MESLQRTVLRQLLSLIPLTVGIKVYPLLQPLSPAEMEAQAEAANRDLALVVKEDLTAATAQMVADLQKWVMAELGRGEQQGNLVRAPGIYIRAAAVLAQEYMNTLTQALAATAVVQQADLEHLK